MRIFQLREDLKRKRAGHVDTQHVWSLPGVICPACNNTWGAIGLEYPSVDLSKVPNSGLFVGPEAVPLELFREMRDKIWEFFPRLPKLEPGTQFGASVGKASGVLGGFVWNAWWTVMVETSALQKLQKSRLSLPTTIKANLTFTKGHREVFEFDLPLVSQLANPVYDGTQLDYCDCCGRDSSTIPGEILIAEDSVPNDCDLFRVGNFTTIVLATERFVEVVATHDIKGVVFREVKLA